MINQYFNDLANKAQRQEDLKTVTRLTLKSHVLSMDGQIIPLMEYDGGFYSARSQVEFYKGNVLATIYKEVV